MHFLAVAIGGALGALVRWGGELLTQRWLDSWAYTMAINLLGSLLIGIVWAWLNRAGAAPLWNRLLITGILGGFTTFSSFSLHNLRLIEQGQMGRALIAIIGSVVGGLLLCYLGVKLVRHL